MGEAKATQALERFGDMKTLGILVPVELGHQSIQKSDYEMDGNPKPG